MILTTTARLLLPVFLIFSVFLLLRGHDAPGGGFVGGLVASAGFVLYGLAYGPRAVSTLVGPLLGRAFFAPVWWAIPRGPVVKTSAIFDVGVYIVVVGVVLTIMLAREEREA